MVRALQDQVIVELLQSPDPARRRAAVRRPCSGNPRQLKRLASNRRTRHRSGRFAPVDGLEVEFVLDLCSFRHRSASTANGTAGGFSLGVGRLDELGTADDPNPPDQWCRTGDGMVGNPPRPSWHAADLGGGILGQLPGRLMAESSVAALGANLRSRCTTILSYILSMPIIFESPSIL